MPSPTSPSHDLTRPRFAVNSYSTPHNSVYDDIEQTAAIGGAAVGLWEGKFGDGEDQKIADFMAEHGIAASFCVPRVHSILGIPFIAGAEDKLRLPGYHEALGRIPKSRIVVLAEAGHLVNIEKAGEFNDLVRRFLLDRDATEK